MGARTFLVYSGCNHKVETPSTCLKCRIIELQKEVERLQCENRVLLAEKQADHDEVERLRELYDELLMAVTDKHEGQTRHETALSYIRAVSNIGERHRASQVEAKEDGDG